jgi:hypothetical protein
MIVRLKQLAPLQQSRDGSSAVKAEQPWSIGRRFLPFFHRRASAQRA